jgi:hypothetical protein
LDAKKNRALFAARVFFPDRAPFPLLLANARDLAQFAVMDWVKR